MKTGWSDHSVNPGVIYRAVHKYNSDIIEFHIDLDGKGVEYKAGHCWLPDNIGKVIKDIKDGFKSDGTGEKKPVDSEFPDIEWRADPSDGLRPFKKNKKGVLIVAKNNIHTGSVIDKKNGYKIINCDNCGFNHIFPLPTEEELDTIYRNEYYTKEKPLYFERTKEDAEWWNLIYKDRFDTFEELLSDCKRKKILDIGSGPGFFLKYGKERGWDTLGVEPSEQAAEFFKKYGVKYS